MAGAGSAAAPPRRLPQALQKVWPGGFSAPQLGQFSARARLAPQLPQKREPAGLLAPQALHDSVPGVAFSTASKIKRP
jgi:hypothetical protein